MNKKLMVREFILTINYYMEAGNPFEETFFILLEDYNPLIFSKIYPLYASEQDFVKSLEEGIKYITNEYEEHLFLQLKCCYKTEMDISTILEDIIYDIETF